MMECYITVTYKRNRPDRPYGVVWSTNNKIIYRTPNAYDTEQEARKAASRYAKLKGLKVLP